MSGDSTHGVGAAFWALAGVANAVSASAAAKTVLENFVICILPTTDPEIALPMAASPCLEQTTNGILPSIPRRERRVRDFVIPRFKLRGYLHLAVTRLRNAAMGITG
jgi:hypothetical protein